MGECARSEGGRSELRDRCCTLGGTRCTTEARIREAANGKGGDRKQEREAWSGITAGATGWIARSLKMRESSSIPKKSWARVGFR